MSAELLAAVRLEIAALEERLDTLCKVENLLAPPGQEEEPEPLPEPELVPVKPKPKRVGRDGLGDGAMGVLSFVRAHPDGVSPAMVASRLELPSAKAKAYLAQLLGRELVRAEGVTKGRRYFPLETDRHPALTVGAASTALERKPRQLKAGPTLEGRVFESLQWKEQNAEELSQRLAQPVDAVRAVLTKMLGADDISPLEGGRFRVTP